jgi:hypothetical protein
VRKIPHRRDDRGHMANSVNALANGQRDFLLEEIELRRVRGLDERVMIPGIGRFRGGSFTCRYCLSDQDLPKDRRGTEIIAEELDGA